MTKYGPLVVLPANDAVRQAMLCIQDNEEQIVPDPTVVIKKEIVLDEEILPNEAARITFACPEKSPAHIKDEFHSESQCQAEQHPFVNEENEDVTARESSQGTASVKTDNLRLSENTRKHEKGTFDPPDHQSDHRDVATSAKTKRNSVREMWPVGEVQNEEADTSLLINGNKNLATNCTSSAAEKLKSSSVVVKNLISVKNRFEGDVQSMELLNNDACESEVRMRTQGNDTRVQSLSEKSLNTQVPLQPVPLIETGTVLAPEVTELCPGLRNADQKTRIDNFTLNEKLGAREKIPNSSDCERNLSAREANNVIQIEIPSMLCLGRDFNLREDANGSLDFALREGMECPDWLPSGVDQKIFSCSMCGKQFKSSESYRKHVRIHTSGRPHRCNVCHKTFALLSYLKRHRSIHVSESKKLVCQYCSKKYPDTYRLRLHQTLVHLSEDRKYQCDTCSKCFKLPGALKAHEKIHLEEKEYSCEICKTRFATSTNLIHHYKTHTGERPFKCTFCDKSFGRRRHLTSHFITHTGEKPFQCSLCNKPFRTVSNLKQHELMHTGKKSACDICGKAYSRPAYVRLHVARAHTKIKNYSCEMCNERFFTTSELMIHIRAHIGEKPYKCRFCPKTFVTGSRRDQHSVVHADLKPFQCDRCASSYYSHKSLKVHIENHHKEEIKT